MLLDYGATTSTERMIRWYLRWRHSKGFGVHSPYAYRFVEDVLKEGHYGYYSYEELFRYLKPDEIHDSKLVRRVRFIIRVSIFLKTKRIVAAGTAGRVAELSAKALKISFINIKKEGIVKFREGDFLIMGGKVTPSLFIEEAIKKRIPVFAINIDQKSREILERPLDRGLLLTDKNKLILIPREEMAYVAYNIKLNSSRHTL